MSVAEICDKTVKIDGVCITSTRWSVLGNMQLQFSKRLKFTMVKKKEYKGLNCLSHMATCATLNIFEFVTCGNELAVKLLFTTPEVLAIEALNQIKEVFVEAVDESFELMKDGGVTKSYEKSKCCNYAAYTSSSMCKECLTKLPPGVATGDINEFGKIFNSIMQPKLVQFKCDMRLLLSYFGQSELLKNVCQRLELLNLQRAEQVILHIAVDFKEKNKCLLWNLEKLTACSFPPTHHTSKKTTYLPLFLVGHGNYTAHCSGMKVNNINTNVQVAYLQFYTNTFKEFHRETEPAWKTPKSVRALLLLKPYDRNTYFWNSSLEWILRRLEVLRNYCKNLRDANYNVARFETVLSVLNPRKNGLRSSKDVLKAIIERHNDFYDNNCVLDYLRSYDYKEMIIQVDNTLLVAANTLERIIKRSIADRKAGKMLASLPHIGDMLTAAACEMIIGYGMYGKLNNTQGPYFDANIMQEIGIRLLSTISGDVVFSGLQHLKNVTFLQINGTPCLKYSGPVTYKSSICRFILPTTSAPDMWILDKVFQEALNGKTQNMPDMIWKVVSTYGNETCFTDSSIEKNSFELIKKTRSEIGHVQFQDPLTFVNRLFDLFENQSQVGIVYILQEVQQQIGTNATTELINSTARTFDRRLYQSSTLGLLYPWNLRRETLSFVLPLFGDNEDCFLRTSEQGFFKTIEEKQFHIINLYNFAHSRITGNYRFIYGNLYEKLVTVSLEGSEGASFTLTEILKYMSGHHAVLSSKTTPRLNQTPGN